MSKGYSKQRGLPSSSLISDISHSNHEMSTVELIPTEYRQDLGESFLVNPHSTAVSAQLRSSLVVLQDSLGTLAPKWDAVYAS